ncbi:MAG: NAD+ synthase, partial [Fusobacterium sp.]
MKKEILEKMINPMDEIEKKVVEFVRDEVTNRGFKKVILGLSGGIDSALVAFIATKALGKENVSTLMMPYKTSSPESLAHGKLVVEKLGVKTKKIEITPMVDAYFETEKGATSLRKGNMMARTRMAVLFDNSSKEDALVIGTSNKTEILLGYGTQYGDTACGINPIGALFKAQVFELAKRFGVPKELIEKKPSADLWEGQTDEEELGFTYDLADEILFQISTERKTKEELEDMGYDKILLDTIFNKIKRNAY